MTKYLILLCIPFIIHALSIEHSYEKAHQKALQEKKVLIVFLTKKGCKHCNKELQKILHNKKLHHIIEKKAIFLIVLNTQKETYPIEMLYTDTYPAIFFLDKNELFTCKRLHTISIPAIKQCLE